MPEDGNEGASPETWTTTPLPGDGPDVVEEAPAGLTVPEPADGMRRRRLRLPAPIAIVVERLRDSLTDPGNLLALVLIAALALRLAWLDTPKGALIFDEAYYVNAARIILGWSVPAGAHYSGSPVGLDPNSEHPPLGKLLMAGSMLVFGDNGVGERLPSVVAAMIALLALYLLVRAAGETARLGVLAVAIFSLDNLAFVHGRVATLDILVLAPILVGAWLGMKGRWSLAGAVTGIGLLMKLTALYGLLALLVLQAVRVALRWRSSRRIGRAEILPTVALLGWFAVVGVGGLGLLDARFSSYTSPIDHLRHMVEYGASLTKAPNAPTGGGGAIDSKPWEWVVNDGQINYFRTVVNVKTGDTIVSSRPTVDFRGAVNPMLAGGLVVVALTVAAWLAIRRRSQLALWAIVWAGANWLPYVALAILTNRIQYFYYYLPVIPALAVAMALLLRRSRLPGFVTWAYLGALVVGFLAYFPFRELP